MWSVMIIDDESRVLSGMRKIIPWEELQCECIAEANNGKEGYQLILHYNPDIVITDIYMPEWNGIEMIKRLREEGYDGKVIILSGYSDFEYARQAMRLKIDDYLDKPASVTTIRNVMQKLIDTLEREANEMLRYSQLKEKIKLYEPVVKKEWLKSIIMGAELVERSPVVIAEEWKCKLHVVIVLSFDKTLEEITVYKNDWYLFRFAIGNIVKEVTRQYFDDFHYLELYSHQSALTLHIKKEADVELQKKVDLLKKQLENRIRVYMQINVVISIGRIKNDWRNLGESMSEALAKTPLEKNSTLIDGETTFFKQQRILKSMEFHQKISEAIRFANNTMANQVMDELFYQVKEHDFKQTTAIQIGIEMWTIMTYSLYDIGIRIDEMFDTHFDMYQELSMIHSWEDFLLFMKEKIQIVCRNQQWDENLKHRQLVEKMMEFIHQHLHENITLQDIADELYISRNYLGQIFKKIVGEPYKNYITRVRMEKAKKLIQEGNNLIYEVSESVGYDNPAYFSTIFKKFIGYTPSELINKQIN
ncbi:response regulator transcription factor [Gracilibacillus sp. D59]|uniref:response regulator transcription factor n=1 Tax=Gracilibacillus sp. D59 TaxID=3457434 RepID=UPI003FCC5CA9